MHLAEKCNATGHRAQTNAEIDYQTTAVFIAQ